MAMRAAFVPEQRTRIRCYMIASITGARCPVELHEVCCSALTIVLHCLSKLFRPIAHECSDVGDTPIGHLGRRNWIRAPTRNARATAILKVRIGIPELLACCSVVRRVRTDRHQLQVFWAIVEVNVISVMHHMTGRHWTM